MAEFCEKCAFKYGMKFEGYPVFCEGCGVYIEHSPFKGWLLRQLYKLKKLIKR